MNEFRRTLTYNGIRTDRLDIYVSSDDIYIAPKPHIDRFKIPGRNGDLATFDGTYDNASIKYQCWTYSEFYSKNELYEILKNTYQKTIGFSKLIDSEDANYYKLAILSDKIEFSHKLHNVFVFDLEFEILPYKYQIIGDNEIAVTSNTTIKNPQQYASNPTITVYGSGSVSFSVNETTYTVNNVTDYVTLNSELLETYRDTVSKNSDKVGYYYPIFNPGDNIINLGENVTELRIKPRWRCLA